MEEQALDRLSHLLRQQREVAVAPLSEAEVDAIRAAWPGIPAEYLALLRRIGAGRFDRFELYREPRPAATLLDGERKALESILLIGHDGAGWYLGYDPLAGWRLVGIDGEEGEPSPLPMRSVTRFLVWWLTEEE